MNIQVNTQKLLRVTLILLFVCAILLEPLHAMADCYSVYTNLFGQCVSAQQAADTAAISNFNVLVAQSEAAYTNTLNLDATNYAEDIQDAQDDYNNTVTNCESQLLQDLASAAQIYTNDLASCTNEQCICIVDADSVYNTNLAYAAEAECAGDAAATQILADGSAQATQWEDDTLALATLATELGTADGTEAKTIVQDAWTANICEGDATTTYANCLLTWDCWSNPPNCCADACAEDYNNQVNRAYIGFDNALAPTAENLAYQTYYCPEKQYSQDATVEANQGYTVLFANGDYNSQLESASVQEQFELNTDVLAYAESAAECACNITNQASEAYANCVDAAADAANEADTNAVASYNGLAATLWTSWNHTVTNAVQIIATTQAQDQQQEQDCVNTAANDFYAAEDQAADQESTALQAAANDLYRCLQNCNGKGG
jgi:hypothetical protein